MSEHDYYEILGIGRDADLSAIKRAYRQAAVKYHPDKNPGDAEAEERFKEAAEAYAVLSDPEKKARYDRFGRAGLGGQPGFTGFEQEVFADFSDILGDLFGFGSVFGGGRRRSGGGAAGRDLRYDLEIEFEEAVFGLETKIQVPRLESCGGCGGSGAEPGGIDSCGQCGGRGQIAFQQGFFTIARPCNRCGGKGRTITKPCPTCAGQGRVQQERTLTLRIPGGVDTGTRIRMSGEGEGGVGGGPPGDLYVMVHVREHRIFRREDRDLYCDVPISYSRAALGAELTVPTLEGDRTIDVPPGTQSGTRFRVKGLGVPGLNGQPRGDQYVFVRIVTPTRLTDEQRELLQRLAEIEGDEVDEPGLFDRVKKIFG